MAWELVGPGPRSWTGGKDSEGNREYKIKFRVKTTDKRDGPAAAMQTAGLPTPGAIWNYGNDVDAEAWCREQCTMSGASEIGAGKPLLQLDLEYTFSTKPESEGQKQGCETGSIKDPLLQPPKVKGNFAKYMEEASFNRFGRAILTSSFERVKGSQNEWDKNRPCVVVEHNVASLGLDIFTPMIDTVNSLTLWGIPRRCIKLSDVSWEALYYGLCYKYYKRVFNFDIRFDGFDRNVVDEGTKALRGDWDRTVGSPTYGRYVLDSSLDVATARLDPNNFVRFKDWNGENVPVILDGRGMPYDPDASTTTYYWVVWEPPTEDTTPQVIGPLTFSDAFITAAGVYLFGPFDSSIEANEAITSGDVGSPVTSDPTNQPGNIHIEKYNESNFLLAGGIPLFF